MQREQVVLRLRVVRLQGSENRLTDVVTIIAGPFAVTLRVADSEWAVLTLDSVMEPVIFQAKFENASCVCREISGRRRVDFSPHLSMLIEGYWFDRCLDKKQVDSSISAEKVTTEVCEISFPSTNGISTHIDTLENPDDDVIDSNPPPPRLCKRTLPKGPVEIALDWISSDFLVETPTVPVDRITYYPQEHTRLKWAPDVTLMNRSGKPKVTLESVRSAVEFSQSLDKYYIL
jgi:hypothetical protein